MHRRKREIIKNDRLSERGEKRPGFSEICLSSKMLPDFFKKARLLLYSLFA